MIEQALRQHLIKQDDLTQHLAKYSNEPAVFSQEAPADMDSLWGKGPQYGRIVFVEDIEGDPERTIGGTLSVDIMCYENKQFPEDIEPILRKLIHGYFFSSGTFVVAAQFKNSSYFTQPKDHVTGCTVNFSLLAFPVLTTSSPDVISRLNAWSSEFEGLYVINHDELPSAAWKPATGETAIYWRTVSENPANWIPDTFQTIWRTAVVRGHIFAEDIATASVVARNLTTRLYAARRLLKPGESPIMVNRRNTLDNGADPLRTGQVTVEATYGVIIHHESTDVLNNINFE